MEDSPSPKLHHWPGASNYKFDLCYKSFLFNIIDLCYYTRLKINCSTIYSKKKHLPWEIAYFWLFFRLQMDLFLFNLLVWIQFDWKGNDSFCVLERGPEIVHLRTATNPNKNLTNSSHFGRQLPSERSHLKVPYAVRVLGHPWNGG